MGRRQRPCEYCSEDIFGDCSDNRNGFTMWYEWYPLKGLLTVMAQANDEIGEMLEDWVEFNFNYCPYCGRKLTED